MNKNQRTMLFRIFISATLTVAVAIFFQIMKPDSKQGQILKLMAYIVPYFVIGYDILKKAGRDIFRWKVMDENFLMSVATVGAFVIGNFEEAVVVMLLYQIGELFQSYAVGKSRKSITELMDIRPDYATVERNEQLQKVHPDEIKIGEVLVVQPGEKIAIDGVVIKGASCLDTIALTGESVPREVKVGDDVISGCINIRGLLKIQTTKEFGESTVSQILKLVEDSGLKKSKAENFITRFAAYYTPMVCCVALILLFLPPVIHLLIGTNPMWELWIYRSFTFLVISCPCALVISIPLSFFAGIGGASRRGILIKGANYLERLAKTQTIVFDKTGTVTEGVFRVTKVQSTHVSREELLKFAAYAESFSNHPISRSLKETYGKTIDQSQIFDIEELAGVGIMATVFGTRVAIGNEKLMKNNGVDYEPCRTAGTVVYVALNGIYAGHIVISDTIKSEAKQSMDFLKNTGIRKIVMLTGDTGKIAKDVAETLGIHEVYSELLPTDKVRMVEQLLSQKPKNKMLAFVGDGMNDAPVLARADVGIAMGAMGSDAAIEAADVVLMDDNLTSIGTAMSIAKKCLCIVHENIYLALGVKLLCILLGALGFVNMWLAIFADVGIMVIAVLNALRAFWIKAR